MNPTALKEKKVDAGKKEELSCQSRRKSPIERRLEFAGPSARQPGEELTFETMPVRGGLALCRER